MKNLKFCAICVLAPVVLICFALVVTAQESAWDPPGLSKAQSESVKKAIKSLWEYYLDEKISKEHYLLGESLFLKGSDNLDSVEKELYSAFQSALSGEADPAKLGRVIDMIESSDQRAERLRLKQIRKEERLLETQVNQLINESDSRKHSDGTAAMGLLNQALEIDPENPRVQSKIKSLKELYSLGEKRNGVEFTLSPGYWETRQFNLSSPDGSATVVVQAYLDNNVETWQGYKRYSMSDVRKTYHSNAGRLRVTVSIDGVKVLNKEFKGEEIAYLGRNWETWEKPHFETPDQLKDSFDWEKYDVSYTFGSAGSRWKRNDGEQPEYPRGRIEKAYLKFQYVRRQL